MGLELYSVIESSLDIEEEVKRLHSVFLKIIFEYNLNDIIDIGCGQGAFMMHLLANNKDVYGIDLSKKQIKVCQSYGLNADFLNVSEVKEKFSCATATFDVLNYIKKDDLTKFLKDIYNTLKPNSYFLFDVNTFFGFNDIAQGSLNINKNDTFIAIDSFFDENILNTDITLFEKDKNNLYKKVEDSISQYYYESNYLKTKLLEAGFVVEEIRNINLYSEDENDKQLFICKKV